MRKTEERPGTITYLNCALEVVIGPTNTRSVERERPAFESTLHGEAKMGMEG